jgi:hypothetical protein
VEHIEPSDDEVFVGKPREPQDKKRRPGRPRKLGRKRKKRDAPDRPSPSQRAGARWATISMPVDAYVMLKEIAAFRKVSLSKMVAALVEPEFEKIYQESLLLMRIEQRRKKEEEEREALRRNNPAGRTHF